MRSVHERIKGKIPFKKLVWYCTKYITYIDNQNILCFLFCFEVQGDLGKAMTELSPKNDTHLKKVVKSDTKIIFVAIYDKPQHSVI